jgi:hypothetical protein
VSLEGACSGPFVGIDTPLSLTVVGCHASTPSASSSSSTGVNAASAFLSASAFLLAVLAALALLSL